MIESKNDASRNLEKALQALEQAKQRAANEKKDMITKVRERKGRLDLPIVSGKRLRNKFNGNLIETWIQLWYSISGTSQNFQIGDVNNYVHK